MRRRLWASLPHQQPDLRLLLRQRLKRPYLRYREDQDEGRREFLPPEEPFKVAEKLLEFRQSSEKELPYV